MKRIFILLILLLFFGSVFAAITQDTAKIMVMPYEMCVDRNDNQQEQCFMGARPQQLSDCDLLEPEFKTYNQLVLNCYSTMAYSNPTACELMPLNDANKQLCFTKARVCDKIDSVEERDFCYRNKSQCDKITSETIKSQCLAAINKKNTDSLIGTILYFLAIAILIISPLVVIAIIIKTIIDFFKHISIISWIIRIGLIIFFIVLWVIVGILFLAFTMAPKMYY
jgi:hypothetical protein